MAGITKLQIGLIVGAVILLFLSVPLTLVGWLLTHKSELNSYETPPMDWGRLISRSMDPKHSRSLLAANLAVINARKLVAEHKIADALAKYREAIAVYEEEVGPNSVLCLSTSLAAGRVCVDEEEWDEAKTFFQRVIDDSYKGSNGGFNSYTCAAMQWIAFVKESNDDLQAAEATLKKCLELQEGVIGKDAEDLIYTLEVMARVVQARDPEHTERLYQRALKIAKLHGNSKQAITCYTDMAEFYSSKKMFEKTLQTHLEILKLTEQKENASMRPQYLEAVFNDYFLLKNYPAMLPVASECLELRRKEKRSDSFFLAKDKINLAVAEFANNHSDKGNSIIEQVIVDINASKSPYLAYFMSRQSRQFVVIGRWQPAEKLLAAGIAANQSRGAAVKEAVGYLWRSQMLMAQLLAYEGKYDACKKLLLAEMRKQDSAESRRDGARADLILLDYCTHDETSAFGLLKEWQAMQSQKAREKRKKNESVGANISRSAGDKYKSEAKASGMKNAVANSTAGNGVSDRVGAIITAAEETGSDSPGPDEKDVVSVSSPFFAGFTAKDKHELKLVDTAEYGKFILQSKSDFLKLVGHYGTAGKGTSGKNTH